MQVGVRDLKAHLSDYLDRAEEGETITVTAHGRPKAVLGPTALSTGSDPVKRRIEQAIREGWITPGKGKPGDLKNRQGFKASRTVEELLNEDRFE